MNGKYENKEQIKTFLQSYQALSDSIKILENLLIDFEAEQNQSRIVLSGNPGTYQVDMEMTELFSCIKNQLEEKNLICKIIVENVNEMESETEKNILLLKYISGYTWEEISELTNYSLRQVYNIHNHALEHFSL